MFQFCLLPTRLTSEVGCPPGYSLLTAQGRWNLASRGGGAAEDTGLAGGGVGRLVVAVGFAGGGVARLVATVGFARGGVGRLVAAVDFARGGSGGWSLRWILVILGKNRSFWPFGHPFPSRMLGGGSQGQPPSLGLLGGGSQDQPPSLGLLGGGSQGQPPSLGLLGGGGRSCPQLAPPPLEARFRRPNAQQQKQASKKPGQQRLQCIRQGTDIP